VLSTPPPEEGEPVNEDDTTTTPVQRTQRHSVEHTDDVLCVAVSDDGALVATGQAGASPKIVVWSADTGVTLAVLQVSFKCFSVVTPSVRRFVATASNELCQKRLLHCYTAVESTVDAANVTVTPSILILCLLPPLRS
jgi:WD40 repeat protein